MESKRTVVFHKLLLWMAVIVFMFMWGLAMASAAEAATLTGISVSGPSDINENTSTKYKAVANFSNGETETVTSDARWSENSSHATISKGNLTAGSVNSNQSVTITASYSHDGVTKTASKTATIVNAATTAKTLSSVTVTGPSSINEGASSSYTATATFSDGSTQNVTANATWSDNSSAATISSTGVLTAGQVTGNQNVSLTASYTSGGVTRTASMAVKIVDTTAPPPVVTLQSISIGGPGSLNENTSADFPVTATMSDGTTKPVTAGMTENSPYAAFSGVRLTATEVSGNQVVAVAASYAEGGLTRTASKQVTIVDTTAAPPPIKGSHAGRFDSYAGATTCLPCHRPQAVQVYKSEHYQWTGKFGAINDFCIYPDINTIGKLTNVYGDLVDGGCLKCHPGLGAKPTKAATPTDADLANIDCLVCHAPSYKRTVDPATKTNYIPDEQAMGMTILEAAADIRPTTRDTCLNCHTKSGGGDNFKRGDIEEHHRNPATREFDVHMSSAALGGGEMHCTECHTVSSHKIAGRGVDLRIEEGAKTDCTTCHTATPPHSNANINRYHVNRVHCATCHIPSFAKNAPTDMFRDWGAHGELNTTTGLYDPARTMQSNVTPQYKFWDGKTSVFYNFGSAATVQANGNVLIAGPGAASLTTTGAKIHPFKVHTASQPIDAVTDFLLPLKIGRFYMEGDLVNAIPLGQDGVGWPRNAYGYQGTERWMGVFHEVAPKERALAYNNACTICHGGTAPKMDLKAMGYAAKKPTTDLCNDCHGSKSYSFSEVHPRHTNKGYDCSACHTFSRAQ